MNFREYLKESKIPNYGITRIEHIDPMGNKQTLSIGVNDVGKFLILLKNDRASLSLANLMFRSRKGTAENKKILSDALTKAYVSSKNNGKKILDALLDTTQLKNTNHQFKIINTGK